MTTMHTHDTLDPAPEHRVVTTTSPTRAWAVLGAVAGLCGVVAIQASSQIDAVYDKRYAGDADTITERLDDFVPQLLVLHFGMVLAAVLMLVFAAGLRRRLSVRLPADSLLPGVAAAGLALTSTVAVLGAGFTTEIVFGLNDSSTLDPEFGAVVGHWVGTIPWLWLGAGVTGVAVAAASLRHGAAPRWLGWVAAVLGGLTLVAGLSPLQYMAGFTGPVLVLLLGLGFTLGDRRSRAGH
jgi:hypothetical protein